MLSLYAYFTRFDSILTSFGDQCMVVRRTFFNALGGFPDWPLFEDVHFLQKARKITRIQKVPADVTTSSDKFVRNGVIRQQLKNGSLIFQYIRGVSPEKLALQYEQETH